MPGGVLGCDHGRANIECEYESRSTPGLSSSEVDVGGFPGVEGAVARHVAPP